MGQQSGLSPVVGSSSARNNLKVSAGASNPSCCSCSRQKMNCNAHKHCNSTWEPCQNIALHRLCNARGSQINTFKRHVTIPDSFRPRQITRIVRQIRRYNHKQSQTITVRHFRHCRHAPLMKFKNAIKKKLKLYQIWLRKKRVKRK